MHDETQVGSAVVKGDSRALAKRLRFVVWLPLVLVLVLALACASVASAATVRPAVEPGTNWSPLARGFAPSDAPFVCGRNGGLCYLPQDLQQAYDFPTGTGAPTGAGQTILLVTAYGAPAMQPLLQVFDSVLGIPDPPSFEIYNQQSTVPGTQGSGATFHWQVETALDVEWAHAMAPGAKIVLAVASSDDTADVTQVITEALPRYPGAIVSQSFGADESGPASDPTLPATLDPVYFSALLHGGTILAASGDFGASNGTELEGLQPSAMAAYPASDPLVLAVGGTMGNPGPDSLWRAPGGYGGEQVWNEIFNGMPGATGGAPSTLFDAPPWQRNLARTHDRLEPDVSYNAAANGGVLVAIACAPDPATNFVALDPSTCDPFSPLTNAVGGTSAGAPQWAAIIALANDLRTSHSHRRPVGLVAPMLYDIAKDRRAYARDFHDITVGNNALNLSPFGGGFSAFGFSAAPGYDVATGLGTPDVSNLIRDLASANNGNVPGGLFHGFKGDVRGHFRHHHFDPSR
jgi:subtilase family serine protease